MTRPCLHRCPPPRYEVFNRDTDAVASWHQTEADANRAAEALNRYSAWEGDTSFPWCVWNIEERELAA